MSHPSIVDKTKAAIVLLDEEITAIESLHLEPEYVNVDEPLGDTILAQARTERQRLISSLNSAPQPGITAAQIAWNEPELYLQANDSGEKAKERIKAISQDFIDGFVSTNKAVAAVAKAAALVSAAVALRLNMIGSSAPDPKIRVPALAAEQAAKGAAIVSTGVALAAEGLAAMYGGVKKDPARLDFDRRRQFPPPFDLPPLFPGHHTKAWEDEHRRHRRDSLPLTYEGLTPLEDFIRHALHESVAVESLVTSMERHQGARDARRALDPNVIGLGFLKAHVVFELAQVEAISNHAQASAASLDALCGISPNVNECWQSMSKTLRAWMKEMPGFEINLKDQDLEEILDLAVRELTSNPRANPAAVNLLSKARQNFKVASSHKLESELIDVLIDKNAFDAMTTMAKELGKMSTVFAEIHQAGRQDWGN